MACVEKVIAERTRELPFIQDFIAALHAADSRIVCTTNDLEAQFADADAYPTFNISIGGGDVLVFKREAKSNASTSGYEVTSSQWGARIINSYSFFSYASANDVTERRLKFKVISGADMIFVNFYSRSVELAFQSAALVGATKGGTWSAGQTEGKLITYRYSLSDGTVASKIDRIPYIYNASNPAQIAKITGKIFNTSVTDQPVFTVSSLLDCSTVPYGSFITIGGTRYYALDEHTLMGVDT